MSETEQSTTIGFCHNPYIWFGNTTEEPLFIENSAKRTEIVDQLILSDLRISVARDGVFNFDFSKWVTNHEDIYERRDKQVSVMNLYLLCFYASVSVRGLRVRYERSTIPMMLLNLANLVVFQGRELRQGGGYSNDFMSILHRRQSDIAVNGFTLPIRVIEISFKLFEELWTSPHKNDVLLYSDLLLSSHVMHFNGRYSESLNLSWQIIESLIKRRWESYIC